LPLCEIGKANLEKLRTTLAHFKLL